MRLATILAFIAMLSNNPTIAQDAVDQQRTIPVCGVIPKDHKQVGWGKYGLFFSVPRRGMKDSRNVSLVLWFGPYAFNSDPDKEILRASASVMKMKLIDSNGVRGGARRTRLCL
ncbi:MAG TPA: hypothetical protein VKQ11_19560 [Candidatus Sulfotelmatobacter sp.]|nr:hypothetical protein [Candidatus Sulfotelmatobacter sp.]